MAKTEQELAALKQMGFSDEAIRALVEKEKAESQEQQPAEAPAEEKPTEEVPATQVNADADEEIKLEEKPEEQIKATDRELTDEELLEIIKKRKGLDNIKSLDDFVPKEDPAEVAAKREDKKMAYAFEKGLITRSAYESYIKDAQNPASVVYEDFAADAKAHDPEITDEQIQEDFEDFYGLNADKETAKYKRGQKALSIEAEKLLAQKHKSYFEIESKYSAYESENLSKKERNERVLKGAPIFKENVEKAISSLSKMTFALDKDHTYDVSIPDSHFKEVRKMFLDKDFVEDKVLSGMTDVEIKSAIELAILKQSLPQILKVVTDKRLDAYAKGIKGIPSATELKQELKSKKEFTEKEKEALKFMGLAPSEN